MSTIELCLCIILDDQRCKGKSISAMNYGINQHKQNLFIAQSKSTEHFLYRSTHLLAIAFTEESIYVNRQLTPPQRGNIHRMNDSIGRLDVYIHTRPLSICHAYPHLPIKPGPKEQLSFRLSNLCSLWEYIQIQASLIVEQNSSQHMREDEQVLGDLQVALSTRTCPSKLTFQIFTH